MTRKIAMIGALALMIGLAALALARRASRPAAAGHTIELASGERLDGRLMTLRPGSYVLQTDAQCLLLTQDEIRRIDGEPVTLATSAAGQKPLFAQETDEQISDSAFVEVRSQWSWRNTSARIQEQVDWGLNEREIPQLQHYRVVDSFGDELPLRIEDDARIHGKRVFVTLRRPVLPGEEGRLTLVLRQTETVTRDGEQWIYRNAGDYPDDRLVTRAVHLPAGARILSVQPEPLYRLETAGREMVVWRRYFVAGEKVPWEIRFSLTPGAH